MRAYAMLAGALLLLPTAVADGSIGLVMSFAVEGGLTYRACEVAVEPGANVVSVLDAALDQGCIDSWSYDPRAKDVECIDERCGVSGWKLFINGEPRPGWFTRYTVQDGDAVELVLDEIQSTLSGLNNG